MRHAWIALLLAALLLAGCAEKPAAAVPKPPTAIVVTSLSDTDSITNTTLMNASHFHDYWQNKTEVVVMEETRRTSSLNLGGGDLDFAFMPPGGHVVPQGTDRITVTASWSLDATSRTGGVELWAQRPHQHDPARIGPIEANQPVVIPTTAADADVPHQQLSAWTFVLLFRDEAGVDAVSGDLTLKAVAHRGLEIPLFPPHPDVWNGRESIPLFDDEVDLSLYEGSPTGAYRCYALPCVQVHRPINGTVVPYDARFVEVTLTRKDPSLDTLGLEFHAADTRNWTKMKPTKEEGAARTYRLPVSGLMGDGPYAAQSQWVFLAYVEAPQEDGWHLGAYHMSARALR